MKIKFGTLFKGSYVTIGTITLFALWVLLTAKYIKDQGLNTLGLDVRYEKNVFSRTDSEMDGADKVLTGEIRSKYINLSMVGVRLESTNPDGVGVVEFRIKEEGSDVWAFGQKYNLNEIGENDMVIFYFPRFVDSEGKNYIFEIDFSSEDNTLVTVGRTPPVVIARSVFPKEELFSSTSTLGYFLENKLGNLFSDQDFRSHFFIYSAPLAVFIFFCLLGVSFHYPSLLVILYVAVDVFFVKTFNNFAALSLIFAWSLPVFKFSIESSVTFSIALVLILLASVSYLSGADFLALKAASWGLIFSSFLIVQLVYDLKTKAVGGVRLKDFWMGTFQAFRNLIALAYLILVQEITFAVKGGEPSSGGVKRRMSKLTLTTYRLGRPLSTTYVYTTRLFASGIAFGVMIIQLVVTYGPHFLLIFLSWQLFREISGFILFYKDFFNSEPILKFWHQLGGKLIIVIMSTATVFFVLQKRVKLRRKIIIALVLVYFMIRLSRLLFDIATPYKNEIVINSIRPQETSEPWVDITLKGRNFGNPPFMGVVEIEGIVHRIIKWTDREIVFRTNPTETISGLIIVKVSNGKNSNAVPFSYAGNR